MLRCRDVSERGSAYLEGDLRFWERAQVTAHVLMCRHCRAYVAQLKKVVALLHGLPAQPEPEAEDLVLKTLRSS